MPCFKPFAAYRSVTGVTFKHTEGAEELQLPCGNCIGCRLERSRQWAVRMMHEAQMHEDTSFITLTYSPEHLPGDGSVNVHHFQDFLKRLRSRIAPLRIRFFHCGEYGEELSRPHYHAIIFGFGFPDREYFKTVNGSRYYVSALLDDVWGLGFCIIGNCTFESCAYVARYVTKKMNGEKAFDHYWNLCEATGELRRVLPEYATMSTGTKETKGLGYSWIQKYGQEVFRSDSVVLQGREMKSPRYYEQFYDELELEAIKGERHVEAVKRDSDNTPDRLRVREVCKAAQLGFLKRGFEDEATSF